jgi:hypothetical protein
MIKTEKNFVNCVENMHFDHFHALSKDIVTKTILESELFPFQLGDSG